MNDVDDMGLGRGAIAVADLVPRVIEAPAEPQDAPLRALINGLLQNAWLIGGCLLLVLAAAALAAVALPPMYRVDALLQVDAQRGSLAAIGSAQGQAAQEPAKGSTATIGMLRSRELMLQAIAATGADLAVRVDNRLPLLGDWLARRHADNSAAPAPPPLGIDLLRSFAWGGERLQLAEFSLPEAMLGQPFVLLAQAEGGWALLDGDDQRVVARGRLGERQVFATTGGSGAIQVDALQAADGTRFALTRQAPMAVYEDLLRQLRISEASRESSVLRLSLEHRDPAFAIRLLDEMTKSFIARSIERRTAEANLALGFLEEQLPQVRRNLDRAEEALNAFRTRTGTVSVEQETIAGFARSTQLERERVDLQLKQRQLSQRFEPGHPELVALREQLRTIDGEIARLGQSVNRLPANQRDFLRLQREVETNASLYTALLNNAQQLRVARAGMVSDVQVVDPPRAGSKPVRPQPAMLLSAGAGIGLLLGLGLALLRGLLVPTLRDSGDVQARLGLPLRAAIPESRRQRGRGLPRWIDRRPQLLSLEAPTEPAIESLRSLRFRIAYAAAHQGPKGVLIASPSPGVGKTFISANLAALLAAPGARVLLIEADLRRPRLHEYLPLKPAPGLAEILAGQARFEHAVRREVLPNLDVLLPGRTSRNPGDLLHTPRLAEFYRGVAGQYDYIVIDSAPVLPVVDALALAQLPVSTFVVARAEQSTLADMQETLQRLRGVGARVDGVLFNGIKRGRLSHRSYYAYG